MKGFYHREQERHAPPSFLHKGRRVASSEGPVLLHGLVSLGVETLTPVATERLRKRLLRIHTPRDLEFLETLHARGRHYRRLQKQ